MIDFDALMNAAAATALVSAGALCLLAAWVVHRAPASSMYPTRRHALLGRAAGRSGRTGWLVYNTRADRLEGAVLPDARDRGDVVA